jgi:cytochrome b-561 domain containing protein 2
MRALELAVHGTVAVTVVTLCASLFDSTLFSYHPTLMSVGFLGAMSEGVLTALKFRQLEGQQRMAAIQRHLYIQLAAAAAITAGFYAIYRNKVHTTCLSFSKDQLAEQPGNAWYICRSRSFTGSSTS